MNLVHMTGDMILAGKVLQTPAACVKVKPVLAIVNLTQDGQGGISRNNAVGLEPKTAAHNFLCVLCYFTLCVYLYFLPMQIQSINHNVCVLLSANHGQLFKNYAQFCIFCVFMLKKYTSWVSIKTFCYGEAHYFINECIYIVEYNIQNTNYNDENTRICLSIRKRFDEHP